MKKSLTSLAVVSSMMFVAIPVMAADWENDVKPIVEKHCASCHSSDQSMYVALGENGKLQQHLDDGSNLGGTPGVMYKYLGGTSEEQAKNLAVFKAWLGGDDAWKSKAAAK